MDNGENEIADRLLEATRSLNCSPIEVHQLLALLDEVDDILKRVDVEKATNNLVEIASTFMDALLGKQFLKHRKSMDVQVSITSCVVQIVAVIGRKSPQVRDDLMMEVFNLILSSFEKLPDLSCGLYRKREFILETVAKNNKVCAAMAEMKCDDVLRGMFCHLLGSIRDYHSTNIFQSIEMIMVHAFNESDYVSADLLTPILVYLKRKNQISLSIQQRLVKSVFAKCKEKLGPHLRQAVKELEICVADYCDIVAIICNEPNHQKDGNLSIGQL